MAVSQALLCGSPVFARSGLDKSASFLVPVTKRNNVQFRVRNMANEEGEKEVVSTPEVTPTIPPPPMPTPTPKPKVSTSFFDVLAFSGPAPERINGRLAMIGFVSAIGVELANGQDIFAQVSNGGIPWFLGTSVLFSMASLIPLFKGVTTESKSGSFMSSNAELWNGRFAMLGLVALALTEFVKGGALV